MAFLVQGSPIITDGRDLSAVGVATLTEDINIGRLLYDANGNVGAADSVLVTKDNILQWVAPADIGISTGTALAPGSTYFVTENGSNSNSGDSLNNAWATVEYALANITVSGDDVLIIGAGDYEETFPLTVPAGLTVKGAGQRATIIRPSAATKNENGFLLNNDTTVEDLSIGDMKKGATNSYAFSFASGAALTTRSPYISRVSIINRGDTQTAADPYGFNTADNPGVTEIGAGGFLIDGSVLDASTVSPSMLLNEVTIFPVKNVGIEMKNGTRAEILNTFVYFADEGIKGESDLATGLAGAGKARLTLDNPSTTPAAGNTIEYYDSDGTTVLASGTVDSVSGNYVTLTDAGTGEFVVPRNRSSVTVNFVGGAELSTTQAKFGPTSLDVTSTNSDAVTAEDAGFGFGTGDFTVEGWFYFQAFTSNRYVLDLRSTSATEQRLSIEEVGGGDIAVNIGTSQVLVTTGGPLTTGVWHHIAIARTSGNMAIFVDGTQEDIVADATDLGITATLHLGADYQDANGMNGYIDDYRIQKGVAKYTGAFTAPTAALVGDKDTSILLHFDGSNGDTSTTDDIIVLQDIRFTGGNTADKVTLADYSEFGADLRCVGSAVEYGNKGVVGDGQGVTLRLISINFNHVGAGGDFSNDQNLVIQANEITETNSAEVSYISIDQKGDFRVGESFYVDQENGTVSFNQTSTDLTSLNSLTITNGTDSSIITPTSGRFGNIQISGNQIESTTGDLNLNTAGAGDVNVNSDLNVVGVLSAASVNLAAIQNGDTAIALDDTGTDGTIRFVTDGTEAGRFTNGNDLTVTNNIGAGQTVTAAFFVGDGSKLTNISAGSIDLTGTYQNVAGIAVTGPGIALTVTNDVSIGGTVSIGQTAYVDSLVLTNPLDAVVLNEALIGIATVTGDLTAQGNILGDGATNISGIDSITASHLTLETLDVTVGPSTFTGGIDVVNDINMDAGSGTIRLGDSNSINVGDNIDLRIFHSGGDTIMRHDTTDGDFALLSATTVKVTNAGFAQTSALFDPTGAAELYHNGSKKLETTSTGVVVTGIATADFFYGDGSNLTNISSGSVDLTGTNQSLNSLILTGTVPGGAAGIGLSVVESVSVGSSLTVNTVFAQEYDSLSDENLKFNVLKLDNVLEKLEGIDGVSYTWKNTGAESIGIIAQDVEKVYPELVNKGEVLSVNYNGLVGVLIRAVKELNEKVEDLQRQLDEK